MKQVTIVPADLDPLYVRITDPFATDPVRLVSVQVESPSTPVRTLLPENVWRTYRIERFQSLPDEELAFVQFIDYFKGVSDLPQSEIFTYVLEYQEVEGVENLEVSPECGCDGPERLVVSWTGTAELFRVSEQLHGLCLCTSILKLFHPPVQDIEVVEGEELIDNR